MKGPRLQFGEQCAGGAGGETARASSLGELFGRAGLSLATNFDPATAVTGFSDDSRAVQAGCVFVAVQGEAADGHRFIADALAKGAVLVVAERVPDGVAGERVMTVADSRQALGLLAHAYWGNPSAGMTVVGITGTNGKTTTAYLVESLLNKAHKPAALFSTVEYRFRGEVEPAPTTTPGALHLAKSMARARGRGAAAVVMEVSSHALAQRRVEGIAFDVAVMTNLTQDHLDYHETMESYAEAKRLLFTRHRPRWAIFNLDDATAHRFAQEHQGPKLTYSLEAETRKADLSPSDLELRPDGIAMTIRLPAGRLRQTELRVRSPLRGRFNASNLLAAAAVGVALGLDGEVIVQGLEAMGGAPGRFETVQAGQPFAIYVDYAHTPDAVERILENVRDITTGQVIAVLGCGGDRDQGKRPKMGAAMGRLADYSILTSDNPRSEDPARIAHAMEEGIRTTAAPGRWEVCLDRREAIRRALMRARPGDSVVIAGKGHENYQIVGTERRHFDDRETARDLCRAIFPAGSDAEADNTG